MTSLFHGVDARQERMAAVHGDVGKLPDESGALIVRKVKVHEG
jgi:hypothetical protein